MQELIPKGIGDVRPRSKYPDNFYDVKSIICQSLELPKNEIEL